MRPWTVTGRDLGGYLRVHPPKVASFVQFRELEPVSGTYQWKYNPRLLEKGRYQPVIWNTGISYTLWTSVTVALTSSVHSSIPPSNNHLLLIPFCAECCSGYWRYNSEKPGHRAHLQ